MHWLERAASERRVGDSFALVANALTALHAPDELTALARRAVDDEVRHQGLSFLVAQRFFGHPIAPPARLPFAPPAHRNASPSLRHRLHILGQCALNETSATAVLEASLAEATGALAKSALRELLADEVEHARIGWGFLGTLSAEERAAVQPWLFALVHGNMRTWRDTERAYPSDDSLVAHGAISRSLLERALQLALRDLIIPGFKQLGFDTAEIERWAQAGAPTDGSFVPQETA